MNNILKIKTLVIGCILILLGASTITVATPNDPQQIQPCDNETIKITIYDSTSRKITKTEHLISSEQAQKIIETFLETKVTCDSFYQQIQEKLKILQDSKLISAKTANTLSKTITARQHLLQRRNILSRATPAALFDVPNFVNLVIFGLKGVKEKTFLELSPITLPFLNGTLSAQFTVASRFKGNGSVFSLGLFGFRYSYGQNQTRYPDFPHFPCITGGVIGFTGLLIDVESKQPGYPGHYVMGVGMSFITIWNRVE
jgi:hypothetical protein